jgi:anaerobic ribonucleoside-triphosphate reductase activating protein
MESLKQPHIKGITLLGGEPFEPSNQRELVKFLHRVRRECPDKNIWCFTGFTLDGELWRDGSHPRCDATDEMLSLIDVLVDGRFVRALKDISLKFRGSSNQRIIDVKKTLEKGEIVLYDL